MQGSMCKTPPLKGVAAIWGTYLCNFRVLPLICNFFFSALAVLVHTAHLFPIISTWNLSFRFYGPGVGKLPMKGHVVYILYFIYIYTVYFAGSTVSVEMI